MPRANPDAATAYAIIERIQEIVRPHLQALSNDLEAEYPGRDDVSMAMALSLAVALLQDSADDPDITLEAFNRVLHSQGYALVRTA